MAIILKKWRTMMNQNKIDEIKTAIRLKKNGYKDLICPICQEKPFIERNLKTLGSLVIRCKCGALNMCERGI